MYRKKKTIIIVIAAVLVIVLGIIAYKFLLSAEERSMERQLTEKCKAENTQDSVDLWPEVVAPVDRHFLTLNDEEYVYTDDIKTYLIIGTDKGSGQHYSTGEEMGGMADMLAVLIVNHTRKDYCILHIDRDTLTTVPMLGPKGKNKGYYYGQICIAHAYGATEKIRCANTADVVSSLLGDVDIDGYAMLSQDSIEVINKSVGGVTVTIPEDMTDVDPLFTKGATITLNDEQAEKFARARMSVGDGHNASRMERQSIYLKSLLGRLEEEYNKNSDFVSELYSSLEEYMYNTISGKQVSELVEVMKNYSNRGMYKFEGVTTSYYNRLGDSMSHNEFTIDSKSYLELMKKLYHAELLDW